MRAGLPCIRLNRIGYKMTSAVSKTLGVDAHELTGPAAGARAGDRLRAVPRRGAGMHPLRWCARWRCLARRPGIELFAEVIPVEWTEAQAAARRRDRRGAAARHSAFRRGQARHGLRDRDPRRQHERTEAGSGGGCAARPEACPFRGARSATGAAARHPPPGAPAGWLSGATFQKCRALPLQRALLLEPHGRRRHRRAGKLHSFARDWHRARAQDLPHASGRRRRRACSCSRLRPGCAMREARHYTGLIASLRGVIPQMP